MKFASASSTPVLEPETVPQSRSSGSDAPPRTPVSSAILAASFPSWFPPLCYLLLAALFLWRSLFGGQVFLPAGLLGYLSPWSAASHAESLPPWNPLRWDGIAQFYPWRHFAAETVHSGLLPLWNPYQFCGAPFTADSQSAPFYPGNLLFYLLPTAQAFGWSALLHLTLCGWFMYLLLRRLRCSEGAALLGGVVFAYSAWQVAWLQLPTFLATSCWFPLLLRQVHIAINGPGSVARAAGALGATLGMMLLAGHLQIAFYGVLAGTLWALALLAVQAKEAGIARAGRGLAACIGGVVLGLMLVAPQLLPSLELSRISHRVGMPTAEGYAAYTEEALPASHLIALALPDFFGGDFDPSNPYWGYYVRSSTAIRHNAAETAVYVGILPLLLGFLALGRAMQRGQIDRRVLFFGGLALLAFLMALGAPIDALFYFHVPGFSQSGSPARVLALWALAWAALAAFGLDALLTRITQREAGFAVGAVIFLTAVGLSLISSALSVSLPGFKELSVPTLGEAFGRIGEDWGRLALFLIGGGALLFPSIQNRIQNRWGRLLHGGAPGAKNMPASTGQNRSSSFSGSKFALSTLPALGWIVLLLVTADLFLAGIRNNPTAAPEAVYPTTQGIAYLQQHTGHERIYPVNRFWNLLHAPHAVLPPNAAMVYHLHDVQGYDSLITGQYKAFADSFALPDPNGLRPKDSSPAQDGNIIFFQDPNLPEVARTSALFALVPLVVDANGQSQVQGVRPNTASIVTGDDGMAVYPLPSPLPRAYLLPETGIAAAESLHPIPATWRDDLPTRVTLETDFPSVSTLHLNDQFYPGWRVTIDDQPAQIVRQQEAPIFRAVSVPAGHHTVRFFYAPNSFRVGLYLACLAWGVLAALAVPPRRTVSAAR